MGLVSERIGQLCRYMRMCGDQQLMEADGLILNNKHKFSVGRNYQCDAMYGLRQQADGTYAPDGRWGFANHPIADRIAFGAIHSYLGEHDQLVEFGLRNGIDVMWSEYGAGRFKAVRSDLFQIFWAKGTDVRTWATSELRHVVIPRLIHEYYEYASAPHRPTIMEASTRFYRWMQENTSQKRMKYSTNDYWLDLSITNPEAIDPESYLIPGPGCRRGLEWTFNERLPTGKRRDAEVLRRYDAIKAHSEYPLKHTHYSRIEAQVCYANKHRQMTEQLGKPWMPVGGH